MCSTLFAGRSPALVTATLPISQKPISILSFCIVLPPERRIAAATPPPCSSLVFAAFTIASDSIFVMSPSLISIASLQLRTRQELFLLTSTSRRQDQTKPCRSNNPEQRLEPIIPREPKALYQVVYTPFCHPPSKN